MRVLFYSSASEWSGSARAFAAAADGMIARGYQVSFACRAGSALEQRLPFDRYTVITLPMTGTPMIQAWRLRQPLIEYFVEVVFVHTEEEQLVAALAARLAERAAVVRRIPAGAQLERRSAGALAERVAATGYLLTNDGVAPQEDPRAIQPVRAEIGVSVESRDATRPVAAVGT